MFKKKLIVFAILILIFCGCTSYVKPSMEELNALRNISIIVKGEPKFSHIGTITDESFWITMAAGPLYSAIARNAIDYNTANSIKRKNIESIYRMKFIRALEENLKHKNSLIRFNIISFNKNINEKSYIKADGIVSLEIIDWGTRTRHPKSTRIFPFMELQISMTRTVDKKLIWHENRITVNDTQHILEDYKQRHDLFDHDFTVLINKVATQVTAFLSN